MEAIIYVRVSSKDQDYKRQIENLKMKAEKKGWNCKRVFSEKISGTIKADKRSEYNKMLNYARENNIDIVMFSEVSRIGRKVIDVLNIVKELHKAKLTLYIQQFDMLSLVDGKENSIFKMLLQMLSIGAEMENDMRKERQKQGIEIAKAKGIYKGRIKGSKQSAEATLKKYSDIVDWIENSSLSLSKIAKKLAYAQNTVIKVNRILKSTHIKP